MTHEEKHIETLVERYFEGATTSSEERELIAYFAGDGIPGDLIGYRPIFLAMGSEKVEKALEIKPAGAGSRRNIGWRSVLLPAAAAAMLLTVVGLDLFSAPDPFEGSFIVRNGKKITDLKVIRPELEAAVEEIYRRQQEVEDIILYNRMIEMGLSSDTYYEEPAQIIIILND